MMLIVVMPVMVTGMAMVTATVVTTKNRSGAWD